MSNIPSPKGEGINIVFINSDNRTISTETGNATLAGPTSSNKVADILNNTNTFFSYIGEDGMENLVQKTDILTVIPTEVKPKSEMNIRAIGITLKLRHNNNRITGIMNIGEGTLQQTFEKKTFVPIVIEKKGTEGKEHNLFLINVKNIVGKISTFRT